MMACNNAESVTKFLESLQNDLRVLAGESKKKYPQIKESCEEGISKIRTASSSPGAPVYYIVNQILYPLVQGCESKDVKIIKFCLGMMQRLITQQAVDQKGARYITDTLWMLMESGTEEVKVLQTVTLLLTSNTVVHADTLARNLVLCFRLHFTKDSTTINTAGATVRQLVSLVFERVVAEDQQNDHHGLDKDSINLEELKVPTNQPPRGLGPCAADAYLMFQDLVQLVNADQPHWLIGITEMTRTFGLELLESVLTNFSSVFYKHPEFSFLLKERVCALVIKLFSPNIKYRNCVPASLQQATPLDKPYFPISMRLLRVVSILIQKYHSVLVTECEIFLSLIVKFLDPDKPTWQRALALEVLHKMTVQPDLLINFCNSYDLKPHATNIFQDIVNSLGAYVHSLFVSPQIMGQANAASGATQVVSGAPVFTSMPIGPGVSPQPGFYSRGIWLPVVATFTTGQSKAIYLEMLDKIDPPVIPIGYGISVSYACLLDTIRSISIAIEWELNGGNSVIKCNIERDGESNDGRKEKDEYIAVRNDDDNRGKKEEQENLSDSNTPLKQELNNAVPGEKDEDKSTNIIQQDSDQTNITATNETDHSTTGSNQADNSVALANQSSSSATSVAQSNTTTSLPTQTSNSSVHTGQSTNSSAAGSQSKPRLSVQLINSSWCGLLAALTPLIEASTDESATENVLKAIQNFAAICGKLELQTPRDAFITAICKASLPPHYALNVLYNAPQGVGGGREGVGTSYSSAIGGEDYRQQVVAVGTPLPTASLPVGAQQGPVMLTAKNLQCMRALLTLAHQHGSILGTAWHLVLTTLQHLVWILGLKPSTGGSLKAGRTPTDPNAVLTNAVMADLPVLSAMLSRLFESSQKLDDVALHHLIDALCKLSREAMELAYSNREPSLFAVAKLLETGLVNLPRVEVLWRPLTNHLLEVCQHPHLRMREWGVEAITYLVKMALQHKYHPQPLRDNQKLQTLLLGPLSELSRVCHTDVRQRQLECVLQILHGTGETLYYGWPVVLGIIGAVNDHHGENLIRIAFQCLQLVVTDFLPIMPWRCLPLCVDTAAKFGSQTRELNISLTAVGLMWNISDYFYQNQERLRAAMESDCACIPEFPGTTSIGAFDRLWMCLYGRLGELCVDCRPAVRKSASQTLFSTISAHGSLLQQVTWQAVLWQVLFPLLDRVRSLSRAASNDKVDTTGNILIHHSRNTAQKQWAETQVLTLSGVGRVFNTKRQLLISLGDYPRAWSLLLEFLENSALSKNAEVSLAALKSFQEVLYLQKGNETVTQNDDGLWLVAWKVWINIGIESTRPPTDLADLYVPTQAFLTALLQIFPAVFHRVKSKFQEEDLRRLFLVLENSLAVPVAGESTAYVVSSVPDVGITGLQDGVLHSLQILEKEAQSPTTLRPYLVPLFRHILPFIRLACVPPTYGPLPTKSLSQPRSPSDWVTLSHVSFAEKVLTLTVSLYQKTATDWSIIKGEILRDIIETLRLPLSMKYNCPSSTTWKLAVTSLLGVLHTGLPLARNYPKEFAGMWPVLANALDEFLFAKSELVGAVGEEILADEAVDCQVMELLRDQVLTHAQRVPQQFVLRVVMMLNKGSIQSAGSSGIEGTDGRLREEFAKTCFETLLQFSLLDGIPGEKIDCIDKTREKLECIDDQYDKNHDRSNSIDNTHSNTRNKRDDTAGTCNKSHDRSNNINNKRDKGHEDIDDQTHDRSENVDEKRRDRSDCSIDGKDEGGVAGRLAVTALLHRFQEVLRRYIENERRSGKCPLPRYRLSEISFVLKAVATLVVSLKKAPSNRVERSVWEQLIALYPCLVECTIATVSSSQVSRSLREALLQYHDLLKPPNQNISNDRL